MHRISIRRVYEPAAENEGRTVLVDRLWPRGISHAELGDAPWLKDIAPSEDLRHWFAHDPAKYDEFARRYRAEIARDPDRSAAFDELRRFAAEGGQQLQDFALWCAIREEIGKDSPLWEDEAAGPDSPYAVEARTRLQGRVHFHIWLQWLLDEQLASAQHAADSAGMAIGVMHGAHRPERARVLGRSARVGVGRGCHRARLSRARPRALAPRDPFGDTFTP